MNIDSYGKYFLSGIGGSSMSSLAKILKLRGKDVCGSDMQSSGATDSLTENGIRVKIGQVSENITNERPDAVVKTDAVSDESSVCCCLIFSILTVRNIPYFSASLSTLPGWSV